LGRVRIDENLPGSLPRALRTAGHHAEDLGDLQRRGSAADEVFDYARASRLTLVTRDVGFGNIARFPLGPHHGVVVIRFVATAAVRAVAGLSGVDLVGNLVVVGPGRVRLRRPPERGVPR
jgi:predicted nuclease of predicted toxin-antitoxin system